MQSLHMKIENSQGISSRAAALLVQVASKFKSLILIEKDEKRANAKSIMGLMSLMVDYGDEVTIITDGEDEKEALEAVLKLIQSDFSEQVADEITQQETKNENNKENNESDDENNNE